MSYQLSQLSLLTTSTLDKINNGINITYKKLNNMYNNTYLYTLNGYRNLMIEKTKEFNIEKDTVDSYLINRINNEYYPNIKRKIDEIAALPLIEQKTPEWFKQRETMISASDAGYFLKTSGASKAVSSLKIKVKLSSYVSSNAPPLMHGNTYEDVARAIYESRNSVSVTEYGILSSPTPCIGASPDGIVTACHKNSFECQSKFGRLLEIKCPYSREIDNTIKPEYMVQILQQQYTTQIPVCDFVELTIVDAYCNTNNSNYKPYMNLSEMLSDTLDKENSNWESRIKNNNIPSDNLNKFGNEKGVVVWYKKRITDSDTRNKYIMYPLTSVYDTLTIEKWIVDTNSEQFKDGFKYVCTKYWRLDVYSEKTVIYDQNKYEGEYVPKLCAIWDVIGKCNTLKIEGGDVAIYIEEMEANKESPFYNENKRKKKAKLDDEKEDDVNNVDNTSSRNASIFAKAFKPNKDIELDF